MPYNYYVDDSMAEIEHLERKIEVMENEKNQSILENN